MIASVFYAQPLGYLFAGLVTLMVLHSHRHHIPNDPLTTSCDEHCHQALDNCWRIIVGIGVIPALIAVGFRRTIPESPLFTADVLNRPTEARDDVVMLTGQDRGLELRRNNVQAGPNDNMEPAAHQGAPNPVPRPDYEEEPLNWIQRWRDYWGSFHEYFIMQGQWRPLFGVSVAWCCFDIAYYALVGSSAAATAPKLWQNFYATCTLPLGEGNSTDYILAHPFLTNPNCSTPGDSGIYGYLMSTTAEVLLILCLGSIVGGALMIYFIQNHSPRRIQATGFLCLFFIFMITGVILRFGSPGQAKVGGSIMLVLAGILFEIGPNFTTFMLPVELFKTQHRALAHGIAAATGRAGAILFQVYVQYSEFEGNNFKDHKPIWLGFTVLVFMPAMLMGLIVTVYLIPETRDEDGSNRRLEVLQHVGGKDARSNAYNRHSQFELWASAIFLPWRKYQESV